MTRIVLEPEAEQDIADAFGWYEVQRPGLGDRFLVSIEQCLEAIARAPTAYRVVELDVRRALLRTFPYGLLYRVRGDSVFVVACFHGKRNPRVWRRRL